MGHFWSSTWLHFRQTRQKKALARYRGGRLFRVLSAKSGLAGGLASLLLRALMGITEGGGTATVANSDDVFIVRNAAD